MDTKNKGSLGERLAVRLLINKKFKIIDQNVRLGKLSELDIVAITDNVLHIIEVKTMYKCGKLEDNLDFPIYNITPRKIKHLKLGAQLYVQKQKYTDMDITIDAIACIVDNCCKKSWIKFYPNILEGLD
jgi:Holliday junction resolvase-like predicted endonuclease